MLDYYSIIRFCRLVSVGALSDQFCMVFFLSYCIKRYAVAFGSSVTKALLLLGLPVHSWGLLGVSTVNFFVRDAYFVKFKLFNICNIVAILVPHISLSSLFFFSVRFSLFFFFFSFPFEIVRLGESHSTTTRYC